MFQFRSFAQVLVLVLSLWSGSDLCAEPVALRIVAANLTSDRYQVYSPDNGNQSNPEGAGARILKALKPDVVLIQEFNTSIPMRQWVNATFGEEFQFFVEPGVGIPNGVISRFPIVASGEWEDVDMENRDFAWVRIRLPNERNLWAVSVHLKAGGGERDVARRHRQTKALMAQIQAEIPTGDLVVLGGDLNTQNREEDCLKELGALFSTAEPHPFDQAGNGNTNKLRVAPYDWVLADGDLHAFSAPTVFAGDKFPSGLVFDTRVFEPISEAFPAQTGDSGFQEMQHMAVARDFSIP